MKLRSALFEKKVPTSRLQMQARSRCRFIREGEAAMAAVVALVHRLLIRHDEGQDLIEYGLLVALIAIVAMTVVGAVLLALSFRAAAPQQDA